MCGAFQQEDNNNSYGQFLNDATAAPKNVLDIMGNFNKRNAALEQTMKDSF